MQKKIRIVLIGFLASFQILLKAELQWQAAGGWRLVGNPSQAYIDDPKEFEVARGLMNIARDAHENGKNKKAIKFYRTVVDRFPGSVFAPEALYQTARVENDQHSYRQAFKGLASIILGYPDYENYNEVIRFQFSIATHTHDAKKEKNFGGFGSSFKDYERSVVMYETIVNHAPFSDYAPAALLKTAELQIQLNEVRPALDTLDRLINDYPDSHLRGDACFLSAAILAGLVDGPEYDQGATREAISHFEDFLILFPTHPKVKDAEKVLATMKSLEAQSQMVKADFYYFRWKDLRAARIFYNLTITTAPESPEAVEAKKMLEQIDARMIASSEWPEIKLHTLIPGSVDAILTDTTKY